MKRRLYLVGLIVLFFCLFPIVIFYAIGYRFKTGLGFVQMGGIYVSVPYSDASVVLDSRKIGTSNILNHGFYIANLIPGVYTLHVDRPDTRPWGRTIVVEPQLVTDVRALLVPQKIELVRLVDTKVATTSERALSHTEYLRYSAALRLPAATTSASSLAGEKVVVEKGNVFVRWSLPDAPPPSYFCTRPSSCALEIAIEQGGDTATSAVFFGSGIVYRTEEGGVFFREAEVRPTAVALAIYPKYGADFRIIDGHLVVKDGAALLEVENL